MEWLQSDIQDFIRFKHRVSHLPNKLRCALSHKTTKHHCMSIWITIVYCGHIRVCINPDDSDIFIFSVQIIKRDK